PRPFPRSRRRSMSGSAGCGPACWRKPRLLRPRPPGARRATPRVLLVPPVARRSSRGGSTPAVSRPRRARRSLSPGATGPAPPAPPGPGKQFLSVDGAFVPLLHGEWAEVKTLALGVIGEPIYQAQTGEWVAPTRELSYFSRLADADTFGRRALIEAQRRGAER